MKISLTNCGKRFNREWIFRKFSYEFISGQTYAITGPNGSGKSTLLQVIAGALVTSEGKISYEINSNEKAADEVFRHISIAAPYLEVVEEMTLMEFLKFHQQFKPFLPGTDINQTVARVGLATSAHKQIRYYSSGMKQRVKLIQAVLSDVSCVFLDEPCTNLDQEGISMYQQLIKDYKGNRTIIVSSNDLQEYGFCEQTIRIQDYK
ncbi:MAG: ABC transporter ATP-binding protein [Chitinophagaceae bacterium]|nr:MAG: ABC transporter ATP-binding protein [Chitinophagaceae bacterium]